jgi:DNA polymerase type B, organellar and viral
VRKAYLGGATDYYKDYGTNLYYYDVNSLYPFVMLKPMPYQIVKDMSSIDLNNFFGYCEARIISPDILRPLLPLKHQGKTIFPIGS